MKVTKRELLTIWKQLESCKQLHGVKFVYAASKNRSIMRSEIKSIESASQASSGYIEFENSRIELLRELADRLPNGQPMIIANSYQLTTNRAEFQVRLEDLRQKYEQVLHDHDANRAVIESLLDEEFEFTPYKIKLEDLPEEISLQQLDHLDWMIDETRLDA